MNFISDFPNTGFLLVKKKNHIFYKTQKMEIEFKIIRKISQKAISYQSMITIINVLYTYISFMKVSL